MRAAMARAEVGDDVYGEDPTVNALQERVAALLGKEAALFVPSGSMANQIALKIHTRPGDDVIIGEGSRNGLYESGAGGAIAGVQFTIVGLGGLFRAADVEAGFKPDNHHFAPTRLVASKTRTIAAAGGSGRRRRAARRREHRARAARLHLDARACLNAQAATGVRAHARRAVSHRFAVPVEGPRRAGRIVARRIARADARRAALPQDARRRHAAGRHPGGGRPARARSPRRSSRRRSRQRARHLGAAARRTGVVQRRGVTRDQHPPGRSRKNRRRGSRAPRARGRRAGRRGREAKTAPGHAPRRRSRSGSWRAGRR